LGIGGLQMPPEMAIGEPYRGPRVPLARVLEDGTAYENEVEQGTVAMAYLTDVVLPSGSIVACDAIVNVGAPPFEKRVAPGRYPVMLSVAHPTTGYFSGKEYPAFVWLRFGPSRPVRWEMATRPGEDLATLNPEADDDFFGYDVDSGTGCFMDTVAQRFIDDLSNEDGGVFTAELIDEMQREYQGGPLDRLAANVTVDPATGANLVAFMSGMGDGTYPSYWGYDASDTVVWLVTDFGLTN